MQRRVAALLFVPGVAPLERGYVEATVQAIIDRFEPRTRARPEH